MVYDMTTMTSRLVKEGEPFEPLLVPLSEIMKWASEMLKASEAMEADRLEADERAWLTFWAGPQWGDEAPNRLFGAWLNQDGEGV